MADTAISVFGTRRRKDPAPRRDGESLWAHLDRSAEAGVQAIRDLIDAWLSRYPDAHRNDVVGRLCSVEDQNHANAFLELLLHEIFWQAQAEIEVHPNLDGASTRPEFRLHLSGKIFYVEATSAIEVDEEDRSEKNWRKVREAINQTRSSVFVVDGHYEGCLKNTPSVKQIKRRVEEWLSGLQAGLIRGALGGHGSPAPRLTIPLNTDKPSEPPSLKLEPFLRTGTESSDDLIGLWLSHADVDTKSIIRRRVCKKTKMYGELRKPYIIVVNVVGLAADRDEVMDALFGGRTCVGVSRVGEHVLAGAVRRPDGALYGQEGPRHKQVSGVIWTRDLIWSNFTRRSFELICNPYTTFPLTDIGLALPTSILEEAGVEERPGRSLAKLLGLPVGWPEAE